MNWKISKFGLLKLKKTFSVELSPDTLVVHRDDEIICVIPNEQALKEAALIAAAPELFEALEFLINNESILSYKAFSKLKSAIDRAQDVSI